MLADAVPGCLLLVSGSAPSQSRSILTVGSLSVLFIPISANIRMGPPSRTEGRKETPYVFLTELLNPIAHSTASAPDISPGLTPGQLERSGSCEETYIKITNAHSLCPHPQRRPTTDHTKPHNSDAPPQPKESPCLGRECRCCLVVNRKHSSASRRDLDSLDCQSTTA